MTGSVRRVAQLVTLACVAGMLGLLVWKLTHQQHAPAIGAPAPAFTLGQLGEPSAVSLASLRGHPVVLNFWASWCIPCKSEAPALERYAQQYKGRVDFIGIDYKDFASDALTFVSAHGLTFPILQDGSGDVTGSYGISQVPETYIVSAKGKIVAHFAGPIDGGDFGPQFAAALKKVS